MAASLSRELRNQLARVCLAARARAEAAARAALENLAVHEREYRTHMTIEQRQLRNRLRARGRMLGDERRLDSGAQAIGRLVEQTAYEHWHRLLFTRFLADNHLLMTDEASGSVLVTLEECAELAEEMGARDGVELACRFASRQLPGVFRPDDPVLELRLAANDEAELRRLTDSLPTAVFTSQDALGWLYQFWQAQRKDEVNASGKKIGAEELPAVTQLFTEDYMVEFLLHNTLGAWWAGKLGPVQAATEEEARAKSGLPAKSGLGLTWTYLRFVQDESALTWSPAAGTFAGWPRLAAQVTVLDPCMGSGHFLVFALPLLARLRMEEEGLSAAQAIHAVLLDNLHGLEIDERCAQIAAFNLALTAWRLGGYQSLPLLHLACSGLAPNASEKDWVELAGNDDRLKNGMAQLYSLFKDAPALGSLINPRVLGGELMEASFHELQPLLEKALTKEAKDDTELELAVTARGLAKAAEILAGQFTLVATNVPYLGRGKQGDLLRDYCERFHSFAKADLATCFFERCFNSCIAGCTTALITPQSWWFLPSYRRFRNEFLEQREMKLVATLGEEAWQSFGDRGPVTVLLITDNADPLQSHTMFGIDALPKPMIDLKILELQQGEIMALNQSRQLLNPDSRVMLAEPVTSELLASRASSFQGIKTGDDDRVRRFIWELPIVASRWRFFQGSVESTREFGGLDGLLEWGDGGDGLARRQGMGAWERRGVMVSQMRELAVALYLGDRFDSNASPIVPWNESELVAIWAFCHSPSYAELVRKVDHSLKPTNRSLIQVPFDFFHWQKVAAEKYPHGLPKPVSNDPTQWLFNGHPAGAEQPLLVAMARLLGYKWPRQTGSSFPDCPALEPDGLEKLSDEDGIVCLPPIQREQPAANRLRSLLAQALAVVDERALLAAAGAKGSKSTTLEEWLRDECFDQHCDLFHQRPFIWHVWDGRRDGFAALVNYHKLDHGTLQKLTYSHLGAWIRQQEEDAREEVSGAAERLGAAKVLQQELARILEGEAPYDIFVRWKPLKQQAIGWQPDLNDGVRLNIRPFLLANDLGKKGAGILRAKPNIKWEKDRGTEPPRPKEDFPWFLCADEPGKDLSPGKTFVGSRWNNVHLTLEAKRQARE
jgi:hypothetical protein